MDFNRQQAMHIDLSKNERWKALFSVPELCNVFKDGRLFGKIAEHILASELDNLNLAKEGGPFDLESKDSEHIEVKTLSLGGFDTSPSYMLGANRQYNKDEHLERINSIAESGGYYILADNRQLPLVTFYPVAATDKLIFINRNGKFTGKRSSLQANAFLETLLCSSTDNDSQLTIVKI